MRFLLDTNVLLRYCDVDSSEHSLCVDAVRNAVACGNEISVCAQVLIEHWAVATRPLSSNGLGLEPSQADMQIAFALNAFYCVAEPPDMADRWREVARAHAVRGKQAHDARIAALMLARGITHILTLNSSDFTRYDGITPVTPQQLLDQLGR